MRGMAQLQRGTYSDRGARLPWSYWSTAVLDGATVQFRLFQQPWAGAITRDLTNMSTAGSIPSNQNFLVKSIGVQYVAIAARLTLATIHTLLTQTICELMINGKDADYQRPLLQMLNYPFAVENATGAANIVNQMAFCPLMGADKLAVPIRLAANVPFEVRLTCTAPNNALLNGDWIKIFLNGTLIRAM